MVAAQVGWNLEIYGGCGRHDSTWRSVEADAGGRERMWGHCNGFVAAEAQGGGLRTGRATSACSVRDRCMSEQTCQFTRVGLAVTAVAQASAEISRILGLAQVLLVSRMWEVGTRRARKEASCAQKASLSEGRLAGGSTQTWAVGWHGTKYVQSVLSIQQPGGLVGVVNNGVGAVSGHVLVLVLMLRAGADVHAECWCVSVAVLSEPSPLHSLAPCRFMTSETGSSRASPTHTRAIRSSPQVCR